MKKFLFYFVLAMSAPVLAAQPSKVAPAKAQAPAAAVSPELAQQREARKADIEYWLTRYDGAELKSGQFACRTPRVPQLSKENDEITRVGERVTAWQLCYNSFVDSLAKNPPSEQRIPKDVLALMTAEEKDKALAHIKAVQADVGLTASVKAKTIMSDYEAWLKATEAWVDEHNKTTKKVQEANAESPIRRRDGWD